MKDEGHAEMIRSWIGRMRYVERKIPFELEVPYNFFGERGFIDLVVRAENHELLFEFKTQIDDLGKTIRQFKRMTTSYPKCRGLARRYGSMLILLDTPENEAILRKYHEMLDGLNIRLYDPRSQETRALEAATPTPPGGGS